jgi:hypothetical protein
MPSKNDRQLRPHQLRDADAFNEISALLNQKGYTYGGLILNFPPKKGARPRRVDTSFVTSNDLIVLTTRPPLDDEKAKGKKLISRSHTTLENKVFAALRPYLRSCTRLIVELSPRLAEQLPVAVANRACIEFKGGYGATYKSYSSHGLLSMQKAGFPSRTAMYLVHPPKRHKDDPDILCAFGMGGTETLIWAYLLRTKFPDKLTLDAPRFVMAELTTHRVPLAPIDFSFADTWQVEFLLDVPL